VDALPSHTTGILNATGRVPLALALVAAAVRGGMSWQRLTAELHRGADTFLDHPYANTFKAMQVATKGVRAQLRTSYVSLAVYPPDTAVQVDAVVRYWGYRYGITADTVRADLSALAKADLLRLVNGHITFHDLQHDYLLLQAEGQGGATRRPARRLPHAATRRRTRRVVAAAAAGAVYLGPPHFTCGWPGTGSASLRPSRMWRTWPLASRRAAPTPPRQS
jgi:hypothetical protein